MYARNVSALLLYLIKDGALAFDPEDELQAGVVITSGGEIVHPALRKSPLPEAAPPPVPLEGGADDVVPGSAG
jgi:hypothetical protein